MAIGLINLQTEQEISFNYRILRMQMSQQLLTFQHSGQSESINLLSVRKSFLPFFTDTQSEYGSSSLKKGTSLRSVKLVRANACTQDMFKYPCI